MDEPTAGELLVALGRAGSRPMIERYCARGPDALEELLAAVEDPPPPPEDAAPCNGRAYVEELEECLGRLARAYPDVFVEALAEHPELLQRFDVLAVAGRVPGPRTTEWLLEALEQRFGSNRWVAVTALIRRREPRVIPRLRGLLRDPDHLVRFAAVDGLRRWGVREDVDAILAYAERAQVGGRERAFDAVESICARAGAPLPEAHPGERLETVELPAGAELRQGVSVALQVHAGDVLGTTGGEPVRAPCDAIVAAIDPDPESGAHRLVLRRTE